MEAICITTMLLGYKKHRDSHDNQMLFHVFFSFSSAATGSLSCSETLLLEMGKIIAISSVKRIHSESKSQIAVSNFLHRNAITQR